MPFLSLTQWNIIFFSFCLPCVCHSSILRWFGSLIPLLAGLTPLPRFPFFLFQLWRPLKRSLKQPRLYPPVLCGMGLSCQHVFLQPLLACSAAFFHTIFPRAFATRSLNDPRPAFLHSVFLPYLLLCSSSFRANSILSPLLWLKLPFYLLDSQLTLPCQTRELFYCRLGGNRLLISTHTPPTAQNSAAFCCSLWVVCGHAHTPTCREVAQSSLCKAA